LSANGLLFVNNALELSGVIDHSSVVDLVSRGEQFIAETQSHELTVDWSQVTYANSAALAMILQWTRRAQGAGKRLGSSRVPDFLVQLACVSQLEFLFAL
jgi:phospholipid transport system transporter-binding protein